MPAARRGPCRGTAPPATGATSAASGNSFDFRAKHHAGNTDPSPANRNWTITPPPTPADTTPSVSFRTLQADAVVSGRLRPGDCEVAVDAAAGVDRVDFYV